MLVQFSLLDLDTDVEATALNLYLNIEDYNASASTTTGLVKWNPASIPTGVVDDSSVIGPEPNLADDLILPSGGGNDPTPSYGPYQAYVAVLVALVIPNGPTSLGAVDSGNFGFMNGCTKLVAFSIPSSVTTIEYDAFNGCSALTSIIIPSNTSIYLGNDNGVYKEVGFKDCTNLSTIIVNPKNAEFNSGNGCNAIITSTSITYGKDKYEHTVGQNTLIRGVAMERQ